MAESSVMLVEIDNKEPASTVSAFHAVAEIMYRGLRTFKIRSTNLVTGDIRITYHGFEINKKTNETIEINETLIDEGKTVFDMLQSRGKRFRDQKQRLSNITDPTIFVLRGWWGDPTFRCPNCGNQNAYVLCTSCKRPSKYRPVGLRPSDSKSIATMMVELMKLGIPAFSVPDDTIRAYTCFKYLDVKGDALTRYRIVSNITKQTEITYRAAIAVEGVGETYAMAIANAVRCPDDIGKLSIDDLTNILKTTRATVNEKRKKPYSLAVSFYNQWHGIDPLADAVTTAVESE